MRKIKEKMQRGGKAVAKSKYETHVAPRLNEIKDWARNGATDKDIINRLGVSKQSFYKYKNENTDFADILKSSKDYCDAQVENALFTAAINGNTTAQIFWLKNRRAKSWRDQPEPTDDNIKQLNKLCDAIRGAAEK